MTKNKKNEATTVASPRLAGQKAQDEFIKKIERLVAGLEKTLNNKDIQLEVEPNVNTIDIKPNKENKKKLN
tara:strand:+ start:2218 stop:2430 length:213 start_codon:yes stop_codon:yes gene_type:complete